jgi:hypothetical protein
MLHHDQPEKQQVLVKYLQGSSTMNCERLMYVIHIYYSKLLQICCQLRIRPSHAPHDPPTLTPRQRILSPFASFWHRSKSHGATEPTTNSQSRPSSWTRNLSGMLRRRDGSDIQLREVTVPCTAGKPVRFFQSRSSSPLSLFRTEELSCEKEATR